MGINKNKELKTCDRCEALNKFIYNHYGVYYCWDKGGRKISEGKDNLPVPTPKWCPYVISVRIAEIG